jgi:malonate transporter and related proteins
MLEVVNLALPFFGLIFLGLGCGKFKAIPEAGLAWMDFFILYVALPALFYRIVAQTPLEELANPRFIVATVLGTFCAVAISFALSMLIRRGQVAESTIAGLAGGYGNIGYMGPGLALATLGSAATAPVALIFCFDSILLFTLTPFMMALAGTDKKGFAALGLVKNSTQPTAPRRASGAAGRRAARRPRASRRGAAARCGPSERGRARARLAAARSPTAGCG